MLFLAQNLCHEACKRLEITDTCKELTIVGEGIDVNHEIKKILKNQNSRYLRFISDFSAGFDETELQLYKWILYAIIAVEIRFLEKGFPAAAIRRLIEEKHPKKSAISQKKLVQALRKSVDLQVKNRIQPIVIEYDSNISRVKVVDRSFILWLSYQDKQELYEHADLTDEFNIK